MRRLAVATGAGLLLTLTACGGTSAAHADLKVTGAYIPRPPLKDMAAGYFTVTNSGGATATLTSVTSDLSADITLHRTQDDEMSEVRSFTVPAGGKLTLALGGNHLMLMNLTRRPAVGDTVSLKLHFGDDGTITVKAPVKPAGYQPGT